MGGYILKRVVMVIPVLLLILVMAYSLIQVAAGDFAMIHWRTHAGNQSPTAAQLAQVREELGLNDPLPIQFFRWVGDVVRLDLGRSLMTRQLITREIAARAPYTLALTSAALLIIVCLSLPLGALSAWKCGTYVDALCRSCASIGIAIPQFWLGLLLMYVFSYQFRLLPMMGSGTVFHLVLPAVTLALGPAATLTRLTRANMLEIMSQDYVSTAFAKGLRERTVLLKHVLRPALLPVFTMVGLQFGFLFGGAVIVETIFSLPGLGKWAVDGIFARDMAVLRAFILMMGVLFVMVNLLVDIVYMWVDPRIRYE